jgi:hypothetical protein
MQELYLNNFRPRAISIHENILLVSSFGEKKLSKICSSAVVAMSQKPKYYFV